MSFCDLPLSFFVVAFMSTGYQNYRCLQLNIEYLNNFVSLCINNFFVH